MTQTQVSPRPRADVPVGLVRTVVVVQLYVLAAYLAAAIIPYLWAPRPYPPTWWWIAPAWLLGVPGFYITLMGAALAAPLAMVGAFFAVQAGRIVSARLHAWCLASTVASVGYAIFALTPLGRHIAAFVAD
ncbi:hypothetical protein AB0J80_09865 [Actinoplanes sp. NPDC049548]|uniref:hypothetical protein n=1 Tax=Actinoplanes sp. NPDC049548 TaxID=3155152 RepID=UPI00341448B1